MKKILSVLFFICISTNLFASEDMNNLKNHFQGKIDTVTTIIKSQNSTKDERDQKVLDTLEELFDFKLMARLSIGRQWRAIDKQKQELFTELYVNRMKSSYSSKLDTYKNHNINVTDVKKVKATRAELLTTIMNGTEKYDVMYKLYKPKKPIKDKYNWLIYDVHIEGVSIIKTDKAQFSEFLKTSTIDDLIISLKK